MNFHDLSTQKSSGDKINLADYKGKPVLVVNTATKCGLAPQFKGLEELHQKYKDKGLVILGFPCNQFLSQEPETDETMAQACEVNFGVTFQLTKKIDVNGKGTDPVFEYLKKELPGTLGKRIKWNFTKFLIGKDGNPIKRYAPQTVPAKIESDIQKELA